MDMILEQLKVPLFLRKLWNMVNDPETDEVICWDESTNGFLIKDERVFVQQYLPMHYKHRNFSSFVRQLNMYDFHKCSNTTKEQCFRNIFFLKDDPLKLSLIKRKLINKTPSLPLGTIENVESICTTVKKMKSKYTTIELELKCLKQENATLWNDINDLHLRHTKQTKILNKIIRFLMDYARTQSHNVADENHQKSTEAGPTIFEIDSNGCPHECWKKFDEENKYFTEAPSTSSNAITYKEPFGAAENSSGERALKRHLEVATSTAASDVNQTCAAANLLETLPVLLDECDEPPAKKSLFDEINLKPEIDEHVEVPCKTVAVNSFDKTTPVCAENLGQYIASVETELSSLQETLSALNGSELQFLSKLFQDHDTSESVVNSSNKDLTSSWDVDDETYKTLDALINDINPQ